MFGVFGCEVVMMSPALCFSGFDGWPSSLPPNGWLVLLSDVLGCGGAASSGCSNCVLPDRTGRPPVCW